MASLKVALFVEGSTSPPTPRGLPAIERIWNELIADVVGAPRFDPIVPISKKHIVALDPRHPKMSGAGEPLDQLMRRKLAQTSFDAAVVAWDLVPAWNPQGAYCRWEETVDFYRLLAASTVLPEPWVVEAQKRFDDLSTRPGNSDRPPRPWLRRHVVVAVCMDPMFEGVLVQDEKALRRALNLDGSKLPKGWPKSGWSPPTRRPDAELLGPAVRSLVDSRPKPKVVKQVGGDFVLNKDGWGEYLLRRLLDDSSARSQVLGHPLYQRLAEWLL